MLMKHHDIIVSFGSIRRVGEWFDIMILSFNFIMNASSFQAVVIIL